MKAFKAHRQSADEILKIILANASGIIITAKNETIDVKSRL